jgi:hypothetical protein
MVLSAEKFTTASQMLSQPLLRWSITIIHNHLYSKNQGGCRHYRNHFKFPHFLNNQTRIKVGEYLCQQ